MSKESWPMVHFAGTNSYVKMARVPCLDERIMIGTQEKDLRPGVYKVIEVMWIADFYWNDATVQVKLDFLYD